MQLWSITGSVEEAASNPKRVAAGERRRGLLLE